MYNAKIPYFIILYHPGITLIVFCIMAALSAYYRLKILNSVQDFIIYWVLVPTVTIPAAVVTRLALAGTSLKPWFQMYSQSFIIQLLCFYLVFDLFAYFLHKILHTPFFYKLHKKHHNIQQLSWENSTKDNIIFELTNCIFIGAFGFFFSFSKPVVFFGILIWKLSLAITHFRKPIKLGPLGSIVTSPHFHIDHHQEVNQNKDFAISLRIWNRLFC